MFKAPDFQRFLTAVTSGQPDRVPPCELRVDTPVKELFLGRPISTPRDDVDFWHKAGYDYVIVSTSGQPISDVVTHEAVNDAQIGGTHDHRWAVFGQEPDNAASSLSPGGS